MAQLAIKGHATRGREVIEILEMLGGINRDKYSGDLDKEYYFINNNYVDWGMDEFLESASICCTLEEFFEKYPYKVGDKVKLGYYPCTIQSMEWDKFKGEILYTVKGIDFCKCVYVAELQPYKEENMEEIKVDIPKGYEFAGVDDDNQQVVFTRIGYQYPKTYEECCEVIKNSIDNFIAKGAGYKAELLFTFQRLLICRDAYWKIAGEEMGLGKPWEPDYSGTFDSGTPIKYVIYNRGTHIIKERKSSPNHILAFPTPEMRDAFYENFKDLIEKCKELL